MGEPLDRQSRLLLARNSTEGSTRWDRNLGATIAGLLRSATMRRNIMMTATRCHVGKSHFPLRRSVGRVHTLEHQRGCSKEEKRVGSPSILIGPNQVWRGESDFLLHPVIFSVEWGSRNRRTADLGASENESRPGSRQASNAQRKATVAVLFFGAATGAANR
jgi:hypothetical protein